MTVNEGLFFELSMAWVTRMTIFFNYPHTLIAIIKGYSMYEQIRILFNFLTVNQKKYFPQYFSYLYLYQRSIL